MSQETFQTIVAIAAVAVALSFLIQTVMLMVIYSSLNKLRQTAAAMQAKLDPILSKAEPMMAQAETSVANLTGAMDKISTQAQETFDKVALETRAVAVAVSVSSQEIAKMAVTQAGQVSETIELSTSILQHRITDLDNLIAKTHHRIEQTSTDIQSAIVNPLRELSAVIIGIRRTLEVFSHRDRRRIDQAYQDEELFI